MTLALIIFRSLRQHLLSTVITALSIALAARLPLPAGNAQTLIVPAALSTVLAGFILLTAMIGAIVLTLRHKAGVKRQNISDQVARTPAMSVELRKVASRAGI